ncbi:MAG: hypothetical protein JWO52_3900 [Gammaproteobacteria bacterium]|nr:hypothetical protein [Gammaproteobacteria bacterium]
MLKPAIVLDAHMSAARVIERLARYGIWTDLCAPAVQAYLADVAARVKRPVEAVAKALARDAHAFGAAIRRQSGLDVLWYACELQETLETCAAAPADFLLKDVLGLHESEAVPVIQLHAADGGEITLTTGVVMDCGEPVAVWLDSHSWGPRAPTPAPAPASGSSAARGAPTLPAAKGAPVVPADAVPDAAGARQAWPRVDAPEFVPAGKPFDVVVGFAAAQQAGVAGGKVSLKTPEGVDVIEVTVDLSAGAGLSAPGGWSRLMKVPVNDVLCAEVRFELMGAEPATPERPILTMLEVRYVLGGTVCGTACRPLVILHSVSQDPVMQPVCRSDSQREAGASPVVLAADEQAPDLTIEIIKTDRDASSGHFVCRLYSPHGMNAARGPFDMDLGEDAKTFAKSLVDEVRLFANNELLDVMLEGKGRLVSQRLPGPVFDALREVAAKVAPCAPAVLIVSAEPYVPWELAWIEPPLDATRPSYLGAQAVVGRWLRDSGTPPASGAAAAVQRPATHPIAKLAVLNMAVLAAWYKASSGFARLVNAEAEAEALVKGCSGLALPGTAQSMRQLLTCSLKNGFKDVGGVEAVHFAGHGDFDPTRPDGSALFLEDGTPLLSTMFRAARYGGDRQPLLFLNGCMLGIGGDLLGDMAGFPGNSLRGGFGGVIGALWEIDDTVAHDIALEFWERALPSGSTAGEPVGEVLRDLRAKYMPNAASAPISTYLAYVYYGHPRLVLQRAAN